MTDRKKFRQCCAWLRKGFRLSYPATVRLVPKSTLPANTMGVCHAYEDDDDRPCRFEIKIDDSLNESETLETLWEEWAHALRLHANHAGDSENHDAVYGAWFNLI